MRKPRKPMGHYEVGYGKPPKAGQFQKGRSGNPKGRPRGSLDFGTILQQALDEKLTINENGRQVRRSKKEIMTKVTVNKALKGDLRAWMELVKLAREVGLDQAAPETEIAVLDPGHAAIVARAIAARMVPGEDDEPVEEAA